MSDVDITLVVGDRVIQVNEGFWFSDHVDFEADTLYCAEINPPLKVNEESIQFVHFNNFAFTMHRLHFMIGALKDANITESTRMTIVTPGN